MQPKYLTKRDPDLPHQVVLFTPSGTSRVAVSCNCRKDGSQFGYESYIPIGFSQNLEESRKLYNDPENHLEPFTDKDEAKW